MALLDLKTNLKSLKYGQDQPGGGNSGQPYQQVDINKVDTGFNRFRMTKFDDGLVRGGIVGAANASVVDTFRIGKFLKDFPKGPLFIVKQIGLQLSNPQLETKKLKTDNPTKGGGLLRNVGNFALNTANKIVNAVGPTRIYNLGINTLAQVPVNAFGQHFNRHGLLPVQDDQTKYLAVAQNNNNEENNRLAGLRNRFGLGANYDLYKGNIKLRRKEQRTLSVIAATFEGGVPFANSVYNDIQNSRIADYIGGPSSVYGIGRTLILRTPEHTNDKLKIDAAKNRNYNAQHIPEVKISSSFDFGISLLTTSNLTDSSFNLIKDANLNINSSFLEYNAITTYSSSLSLAGTNQKNSFISASRNIRNFVQASLRSGSIYGKEDFNDGFSLSSNPDSKPRTLEDKTPLYYKNNSSYKGSSVIAKNDIKLSSKTTSSLSLIKTGTFSGGQPYQQKDFNRFGLSPLGSGSLPLNGNPVTYNGGTWNGALTRSADLGLSKQYFPPSEIDIPRPDNATYSKIVRQPISLTINAKDEISTISEVKVAVTPLRNASYQTYQKIIESRQLRERTYTTNTSIGSEVVNAFGIYGNGTPVRDTLGNILPDSSGLPIYSNDKKVVQINIPWNKVSRDIRVGSGQQDQINLTPIFEATTGTIKDSIFIPGAGEKNINDLVKFRIQALNYNNPTLGKWMIFRAYITQFSDSADAKWNSVNYAGRGEEFYIYNGFTRKVSMTFKVAALSAEEMKPMYQKLNYLMGNLMGSYENNLLHGSLVKMTIGNWFDGQDAIINSLSYTVPPESPWEIAINNIEGVEPLILPHVVEVNMSFTPIGSQTRGVNKISEKFTETSNIAQNINDTQYTVNLTDIPKVS
jgi:hypothetical protein